MDITYDKKEVIGTMAFVAILTKQMDVEHFWLECYLHQNILQIQINVVLGTIVFAEHNGYSKECKISLKRGTSSALRW